VRHDVAIFCQTLLQIFDGIFLLAVANFRLSRLSVLKILMLLL